MGALSRADDRAHPQRPLHRSVGGGRRRHRAHRRARRIRASSRGAWRPRVSCSPPRLGYLARPRRAASARGPQPARLPDLRAHGGAQRWTLVARWRGDQPCRSPRGCAPTTATSCARLRSRHRHHESADVSHRPRHRGRALGGRPARDAARRRSASTRSTRPTATSPPRRASSSISSVGRFGEAPEWDAFAAA